MDPKQLQETIERHKKQGIQTYTITCSTGEQCLIKNPDVDIVNKVLLFLHGAQDTKDMLKAGKIILSECWIAGDDIIRTDKALNGEAAFGAATTTELKIADVKNDKNN